MTDIPPAASERVTDSPWYSVADAARYLRLKSPKTLYSLYARGQLPARAVLRIGRQLRVNVQVIEAAAGVKDRNR